MFSYGADIPETYWLLSDSHKESPIHFEVDLFFIELSSLCLPPKTISSQFYYISRSMRHIFSPFPTSVLPSLLLS